VDSGRLGSDKKAFLWTDEKHFIDGMQVEATACGADRVAGDTDLALRIGARSGNRKLSMWSLRALFAEPYMFTTSWVECIRGNKKIYEVSQNKLNPRR
jgi:hypothetical protein